jgi:hypothetical protein
VEAGSLGIGTSIVTRAGPQMAVASVTWEKNKAQELASGGGLGGYTVYNLTVDGDHTFFVGITGGGTWVHNDCGTIAKAFQRLHGGEIWKLSSESREPLQWANEPLGKDIVRNDAFMDGNTDPVSWFYHYVHVKNGMVRDPMMLGHGREISLSEFDYRTHFV